MKTLKITLAALVGFVALFAYNAANAQVRVSANINLGHPPVPHRTVVVHRPPVVHRTVVVSRPAYRPAPRRVIVHRPYHQRRVVVVHRPAPRHVIYRHR